jgi:hypothetical protein
MSGITGLIDRWWTRRRTHAKRIFEGMAHVGEHRGLGVHRDRMGV